jgi:phage terminase small subunit
LRRDEPDVTPELPHCPDWVRAGARKHWGEVGAMLEGLGVMARPHTLALAMLCEALCDWLEKHNGASWDRVLRACREFGMTPSAITGVKSVNPAPPRSGVNPFRLDDYRAGGQQ